MSTQSNRNDDQYMLFLEAFQEYDPESMIICLNIIQKLTHKACTKLIQDNATDNEDIYQIACLEITRSIRTFDRRSTFSTWLYKIILNIIIDHNRRITAKKRIQVDDPSLHTQTPSLYDIENYEFINLALRLVEEKFGRPIMLAVLFAKVHKVQNQKDIAEIIGMKQAKLSKDIKKALAYLRTHPQILDYGYETGFLDDPDENLDDSDSVSE